MRLWSSAPMGNDKAVAITAELISAYLKNNAVSADDIPQLAQHVPELIRRIHDAFARLPDPGSMGPQPEQPADEVLETAGPSARDAASSEVLIPAVPIEE